MEKPVYQQRDTVRELLANIENKYKGKRLFADDHVPDNLELATKAETLGYLKVEKNESWTLEYYSYELTEAGRQHLHGPSYSPMQKKSGISSLFGFFR